MVIATAAAAVAVPVGFTASPTAATACDATTARSAFAAYLRAFDTGDFVKLDRLFAPEPLFQWYAVAPPHGRVAPEAMRRASLLSFFRARHRQRELQTLVTFTFASTQTRLEGSVANFNGVISRRARDLPAERRGFKATIQCRDGTARFIVVSIGTSVR